MEKEASFLFNNGLSTEAAMDRLVSLGKISIENWECQKAPIDYRCSVDKVLCRNLLLISLVSAASLAVGSVTIENQPSMFLLGLTTLCVIFLLSMHYVQWRMCNWSLMERKRKALKALDYVAKIATTSFSYAPLGEPLSDEMFTQTALRDGEVVAMPKLLLVEGDIILLRPSQSAPCDCQLLNGEVLRKGDRILNKVIIDQATGGAVPLCATKAIALSTPLIEHFNSIGESQRLHSPLEYQLHYCVHVVGERVILPAVVAISVFACFVRFFHDGSQSSFSTRFVFAVPPSIVLPLVAPTFFLIFLFLQQWGNIAVCNALRVPTVNSTKDFVTLFGSLTGTSFFDKKGLLAPMNPCLDKVVFFRPNTEGQNKDFAALEILDLSSEQLLDGSWNVGFDDPNWSRFDSSLRVIGQMLLLNGCDTLFTTFLDHLSAIALTVPRTIATACRRCSCIFPRLVGFKKNAREQFLKIPYVLGFYQRRPGDAPLQGVTKHQTPLEMAYCTLHADGHSLYNHLSCQGTANLVLEACTHVWNGESLVPLTERLIKTATDFYQRHSVTGYCLALSYRPVGSTLDDSLRGYYFEVPLHHARTRTEMLPRTHSFDSSQGDPIFDQLSLKSAEEVIERWFTGHVLCGMVVTQYEVVPQAVQFIDHLENLCVRFVYFSRENELRSRVFAEKLGLEAGWNCHVSLAEIADSTDRRTLKDFFRSKLLRTAHRDSTISEITLNGKSRSDQQLYLKSFGSHPRGSPLSGRLSQISKVAALQNKARLPTGISAVRPHLEQVDNVPLLVGLITDCTPEANLQMLEIMQEYGELVLAIGSSLSLVNTAVFLRADISISVLPLGDWVCCQNPAPSWQQAKEAATNLMGVASDFRLQCDQLLLLPKLIVACRHRLVSVKGSLTFHFLASCMLSLSLLTSVVAFLPLLFDFEQIFLTVFLQLPCLTLGSLFTPFYPKSNVIRIASKNLTTGYRQSIKWAVMAFIVGFCPTSLFIVLLFFLMLVRNSSLTCSFSDVVCAVASNISDAPVSKVAIRHIIGLHQAVYLCALSSAWVYPLSSLWRDNPCSCPQYVISCVVSLVLQVFFSYASGVQLHSVLSLFSLISLVVWTIVILLMNELIKRRSIRSFIREQRRTKLGFDTKLGMNSPY